MTGSFAQKGRSVNSSGQIVQRHGRRTLHEAEIKTSFSLIDSSSYATLYVVGRMYGRSPPDRVSKYCLSRGEDEKKEEKSMKRLEKKTYVL